ncbi:hypothetical protein RHGRI_028889 [Rhododendron griersonianum]|uniref:Transposase n=1 Tax=Rhododendron griersonianum TaxID=479676 RepID=A0AAV6IKQ5_9ERIC|nr:hypothetical protein RHGRI_028889 [Rhododendron griersonianum]
MDSDVMALHTLLDKDRVVKVYSVEEKLSEVYVGTQESQVGRPIKSKRFEVNISDSRISIPRYSGHFPKVMGSPNNGMPMLQPKCIGAPNRDVPQTNTMGTAQKGKAKPITVRNKGKGQTNVQDPMVEVQVDEEDDNDDYDVDSDSSDEDEVFHDSDYGLTDDDEMFDKNIDRDVEFVGLQSIVMLDDHYAAIVEEMPDLEGGLDDSSDELISFSGSSDEEGGFRKKGRKYIVFNEKTDMANPRFKVGMEFKTHEKYGERIKGNPTWPVKSLAQTIEKEQMVKVSIQKVYRARRMALEELQGSAEEQFKQLWGYVEEVNNVSPMAPAQASAETTSNVTAIANVAANDGGGTGQRDAAKVGARSGKKIAANVGVGTEQRNIATRRPKLNVKKAVRIIPNVDQSEGGFQLKFSSGG